MLWFIHVWKLSVGAVWGEGLTNYVVATLAVGENKISDSIKTLKY